MEPSPNGFAAMSHAQPAPATEAGPETVLVTTHRVMCDGAADIRPAGLPRATALGHPRVWLEIDEKGYVDCGYCDRRFQLKDEAGH